MSSSGSDSDSFEDKTLIAKTNDCVTKVSDAIIAAGLVRAGIKALQVTEDQMEEGRDTLMKATRLCQTLGELEQFIVAVKKEVRKDESLKRKHFDANI